MAREVAKVTWNGPFFQRVMASEMRNAIKAGCAMVETTAKESMNPPKSGLLYPRPGNKMHQASAPGESPAHDYGRLQASVTSNWTGSNVDRAPIKTPAAESKPDDGIGNPGGTDEHQTGVVGTNVDYGYTLEVAWEDFGAERPFMRPALETNRGRIEAEFKKIKL